MEIHKLINSFHRNYPTIGYHTLNLLLMADPTFRQTIRAHILADTVYGLATCMPMVASNWETSPS